MAPIIFHGLERLLINCGAIFVAYLGYRLFIFGVETGNSKLEAHSAAFKVIFSGSSPGLFFMVSGLIILVVSLTTGKVEVYERESSRGTVLKMSSGVTPTAGNRKSPRVSQNNPNKQKVYEKVIEYKATSVGPKILPIETVEVKDATPVPLLP